MDALPNELLLLIFKHLNIEDVLLCRLVCKRFMFLCDAVKISEMQVSNAIENRKYFWFPTRNQFNHKDAIDVPTFIVCRSIFRLNECLKRLHFTSFTSDFDQQNLNGLTQLEELRIDTEFTTSDTQKVIHLSLPNLKVLDICGKFKCGYCLTTPKLQMLKCKTFTKIWLADFSTVHHLEVESYTREVRLLNNVRFLKAGSLLHRDECLDILSVFPKLTTLVCDGSDYENYSDKFDRLRHLVAQKLNNPGFRIFYDSVELTDKGKVAGYESGKSDLFFQISNYNSLSEHSCPQKRIDYNELIRLVDGVIPDDFYDKYFNIEAVKILSKVESPNHLVRFLKRLDYLSELDVHNAGLDQSFFDGLPEMGQLTTLSVETPMSMVNYDFLFKLKLLVKFTTYNDVDLFDVAFQLFSSMKYFKSISFYFNGDHVTINRISWDKNKFLLKFNRKIHGFDFDQLVHAVNVYKIESSNSGNAREK